MTESTSGNAKQRAELPDAQTHQHSVYTYESAGIAEREGNVPVWLWIVVVSLLIWGLYYLVTYWNAPVTPP